MTIAMETGQNIKNRSLEFFFSNFHPIRCEKNWGSQKNSVPWKQNKSKVDVINKNAQSEKNISNLRLQKN